MRKCKHCGNDYLLNPKYSNKQKARSKFCSRNCQYVGKIKRNGGGWNKGMRFAEDRKCDVCPNVHRKVALYSKFNMTLCPKHYQQIKYNGRILWGEERPYKTTLERRQRDQKEIGKKWRRQVFERDDFTCQMCKVRGGQLEADHIKPYAYYPEVRWELSNGRTLCKPCHRQTPTYANKYKKIYEAEIRNLNNS